MRTEFFYCVKPILARHSLVAAAQLKGAGKPVSGASFARRL